MSERDPIVLPGLAAMRGPVAAVCGNGHVYSWLLDPAEQIGYCSKCGDTILVSCPSCQAPLPADGEMLKWVPYHAYCSGCGKPYPWVAADISRAKRTVSEMSEAEKWSEPVEKRALELIDEIVATTATPSSVVAGVAWLESSGAQSATPAILDAIERLGSADLKTALRPHFPGVF